MTARPRQTNGGSLRHACWNADGVRCRRLELEHFLGYHGVDICLLSETHLSPEQAFRFANCLPPYRPKCSGRRNSNSGPPRYRQLRCTCLRHQEATAIHTTLADRPVKILAAYLSPSRPLRAICLPAWMVCSPS